MKKIISIILSLMLIITCVTPVFASTDDSAAVEKTVKYVKSIFVVPETMNEFSYDSWKDDEFNVTMFYLNWYDEDYESSMSISIDANNNIYSFDMYNMNGEQSVGLGDIPKAEAQKTAQKLVTKLCPAWKGTFEVQNSYTYGQTYEFIFKLKKADIDVFNTTVSLGINKFTGQPTDFYGYDLQRLSKCSFDANQGAIGTEAAKKAYMDNIGIGLKYYTNYDWENKELKVFPAYAPVFDNRFIDAKTGKTVDAYDTYYYNKNMAAGVEDAYESQSTLSDAEKKEIDNTVKLLSENDAIQKILAQVPASLGSTKPEYSRLYKDDIEGKYYWSMSFEDGNATIDAQTGELTGFFSYEYNDSERKSVSVEKAKATAEKFAQQTAPDKYKETVFEENEFNEYTFTFSRVVNGIPCIGNYQSVTVDYTSGKVTDYNCVWYDIEFPEVKAAKTSDAAFNAFEDYSGFNLAYIKDGENSEALVYSFGENLAYMLNPYTLERVDYLNKPYKDSSTVNYGDISGKWYENIVTKLVDNGYYIEGENFNGNNQITQEQFLRFLYSPEQEYYDDSEKFYELMTDYDIIKKGEKAPDSLVTRQGAAKLLVRYMGLEKAASHNEIYKNMYSDSVNKEYQGYAALVYALNVMQGDAKGRFNGTSYMTNAQAAVAIYNTLELI